MRTTISAEAVPANATTRSSFASILFIIQIPLHVSGLDARPCKTVIGDDFTRPLTLGPSTRLTARGQRDQARCRRPKPYDIS